MKKIVFITGAGVSAESGIPTFRDADGLWHGHRVEEVADIGAWRNKLMRPKMLEFYNQRRRDLDTVNPNEAHNLIAQLEEHYDVVVITQNVDNLHERAGSTNVLHLHGELTKMCSSLNKENILNYSKDIAIGDKHEDGSQLRPYIVWFGEEVPKIQEAVTYIKEADIVVVVGTSLQVYPAAGLLDIVKEGTDVYVIDKVLPAAFDENMYHFNLFNIEKLATEGMKELCKIITINDRFI